MIYARGKKKIVQNKNYKPIQALQNFCFINNLEFDWFFPIRGHSYMPTDRAFIMAENPMKNRQAILLPKEYDEICESCGNLVKLGPECPV